MHRIKLTGSMWESETWQLTLIKNIILVCINIYVGYKVDQVKQALLCKEDIPKSFYLKVSVGWPIWRIIDCLGGGTC